MKRILLALLFLALAPVGRAETAKCWVVCCTKTGDMGIGATIGGVTRLDGVIFRRAAQLVYRINPATGRRAPFKTFVRGRICTKVTWARFVAVEVRR